MNTNRKQHRAVCYFPAVPQFTELFGLRGFSGSLDRRLCATIPLHCKTKQIALRTLIPGLEFLPWTRVKRHMSAYQRSQKRARETGRTSWTESMWWTEHTFHRHLSTRVGGGFFQSSPSSPSERVRWGNPFDLKTEAWSAPWWAGASSSGVPGRLFLKTTSLRWWLSSRFVENETPPFQSFCFHYTRFCCWSATAISSA